MPQSRNPKTCPEPYATRTDPTRTAKSRRRQNWTIGASSRPPTLASRPAPSRRYGARLDRGRDSAPVTDRGVAHLLRAPYVAGIVHRWDFRRPSLPGPGCSWRCPDDRHDSFYCPRHHPAGLHRCRAARARRVPGRLPRPDPRGLHSRPAPVQRLVPARSLPLFAVRRADIETFARELEAGGRARATVTRRLCTIAGFYKYAVEEELLEHSPAAHVRRPRLDYESHATALDRNEIGALLVAAGLGPPGEHALISLLALNGLRVSETASADIEHLGAGTRPPDSDHHPQGRQGRHHPARPAHRPRDRPGHRRAHRGAPVAHNRTRTG